MIFKKTELRDQFEVDTFNDVIEALSNYKTCQYHSWFLMSNDVKEEDTGTVVELTTVPKSLQSNELDLVIWIKWDNNKAE